MASVFTTKLDVSAQIEGDSIAVSQQGGRSAIRQKRAGSSRARAREALRFVEFMTVVSRQTLRYLLGHRGGLVSRPSSRRLAFR
jgi:hypothetical protein